jgi:hypothetical protein
MCSLALPAPLDGHDAILTKESDVSMHYIAGGLAALMGVGIIVIGASYLLAPEASAKGFGLPDWPTGDAVAWLNVKGVRDIVSGLVALVLLATGPLHALGWFVLVAAIIPIGDAIIVLRYGGAKGLAYGMHGGTAAAMVAIAGLLLLG